MSILQNYGQEYSELRVLNFLGCFSAILYVRILLLPVLLYCVFVTKVMLFVVFAHFVGVLAMLLATAWVILTT